jgi:hypothetical protein
MRRLLLVLMLGTTPLEAQRFDLKRSPSNCNLSAVRYDNPFWGVGWNMHRYEWHISYALIAAGGGVLTHQVVHSSSLKSTLIASNVIGVGPHILSGPILGKYPIDYRDWIFDEVDRNIPVAFVMFHKAGSWQKKTAVLLGTVVAYTFSSCWGSP